MLRFDHIDDKISPPEFATIFSVLPEVDGRLSVVRVVYSDESGTNSSVKDCPHTVVVALLLNMDSQWEPVRDAFEAALRDVYQLPDEKVARWAVKGKQLYHQIERGDEKAKVIMARLMSIPRQHLVPIWYGAVDRAGFKFQMENIHLRAEFKEVNRPFMMALEDCMTRIDTWVHTGFPDEQVLWVHDEGSLNDAAKNTLRGFRWLRKEMDWTQWEVQPVGMPDVFVSHIADTIYFGDDKGSRALQLGDVCCSTIARALRNDQTAAPFYQILRRQVQNHGTRPSYETAFKTVMPLRKMLAERKAKGRA